MYLLFDRDTSTLTAFRNNGIFRDDWIAKNIVDSKSNGQWASGYYAFEDTIAGSGDRYSSEGKATKFQFKEVPFMRVESAGIPPVLDPCATGYRTGMRIHAGRATSADHPENDGIFEPTFG